MGRKWHSDEDALKILREIDVHLHDGLDVVSSVIRLRPTHPNHIWAIDFVHDKLSNGRGYKMLTVLDEYSHEALCVAVRPRMNANDVLDALHPLLMK